MLLVKIELAKIAWPAALRASGCERGLAPTAKRPGSNPVAAAGEWIAQMAASTQGMAVASAAMPRGRGGRE